MKTRVSRRRWRTLFSGVLAVIAVSTGTFGESEMVLAQQATPRLEITASRVEGLNLAASVALVDAGGNPVSGLVADNFVAAIDASPVQIVSMDPGIDSALPLGIVIALDTSGSMVGDSMVAARLALTTTVNALRPGDAASFITFAQAVTTVVPPTEQHDQLQTAIASVPAVGNTALFAGVSAAATSSAGLPQPRRAVILLSDGEDFGNVSGGITREQALANAKASGTPYFVVGLGREVDQAFLAALAESTGGQYFAAAAPAELAQLYARISERLRRQYTMLVKLPDGLAAGNHQLRVSYGAQTAIAAFSTTTETTVLVSRFAPIQPEISEPTLVSLVDAPTGATARFMIDGQVVKPESNGRAIRVDPYAFEPGKAHQVSATFSPDGPGPPASTTFTVAALPPVLLEPKTLPGLRAGDLVRLRVLAQPGAVTVSYLVDGIERERDEAAPFEFVLPESQYSEGEHELRVVISGNGSNSSVSYVFPGTEEASGNTPLVVAGVLLSALAVVAIAVVGARRFFLHRQRKVPSQSSRDLPTELDSWVQSGRRLEPREAIAVFEAAPPGPWGTLVVLDGPDSGKSFELTAGTELIGRGKFCSVRLNDKSLQEAHFIIDNEGQLTPSSPSAVVSVDGAAPGAAALRSGSRIRAGATVLEFKGVV